MRVTLTMTVGIAAVVAVLGVSSLTGAGAGTNAPLADAAKRQDTAALRTLLKQRPTDVNAADAETMTALHWAAHWDDRDTVALLLSAGANVNTATRYGVTPLHEAAALGDAALVATLLKAGADPSAAEGDAESVLMVAARTGQPDVVRLLLDAGAAVNAHETYRGETAVMFAAAENHADIVTMLVARGADVNVSSTAFDWGERKAVNGFANLNYSRGGLTPLMFAARQGSLAAGEVLVGARANLEAKDPDDELTALHLSILNYHFDFTRMLVAHGASTKGALYLLLEVKNSGGSGKTPPPSDATKAQAFVLFKEMLDQGVDPNDELAGKGLPNRGGAARTVAVPGNTPFYRAARSNDMEAVRLLLDYGADPSRVLRDGTTSLLAAVSGGGGRGGRGGGADPTLSLVQTALDWGVDINAANDLGITALHAAAQRGSDDLVKFLLDHGANPMLKDKKDRLPYDMAMGVGTGNQVDGVPHPTTAALLRQYMK